MSSIKEIKERMIPHINSIQDLNQELENVCNGKRNLCWRLSRWIRNEIEKFRVKINIIQ